MFCFYIWLNSWTRPDVTRDSITWTLAPINSTTRIDLNRPDNIRRLVWFPKKWRKNRKKKKVEKKVEKSNGWNISNLVNGIITCVSSQRFRSLFWLGPRWRSSFSPVGHKTHWKWTGFKAPSNQTDTQSIPAGWNRKRSRKEAGNGNSSQMNTK